MAKIRTNYPNDTLILAHEGELRIKRSCFNDQNDTPETSDID